VKRLEGGKGPQHLPQGQQLDVRVPQLVETIQVPFQNPARLFDRAVRKKRAQQIDDRNQSPGFHPRFVNRWLREFALAAF
jgi:hypothetical protein